MSYLSGILNERSMVEDDCAATAVWLGNHGIPLHVAAQFRCGVIAADAEYEFTPWWHLTPVLNALVLEHGPFMRGEWGDEDAVFRKLRLYACMGWYLTAEEDECRIAAAMLEHLWIQLSSKREIAERASAKAKSQQAAAAAARRHSEDHEARAQVHEWLSQNHEKYTNKATMARAIETARLVPYKASTIKAWVIQWSKQRTAS